MSVSRVFAVSVVVLAACDPKPAPRPPEPVAVAVTRPDASAPIVETPPPPPPLPEAAQIVASANGAATLWFRGPGERREPGEHSLRRAGATKVLPDTWFGGSGPRADASLSDDGVVLGIPALERSQGESMLTVDVYDTTKSARIGRFTVPEKYFPGGGGFETRISPDGKYVQWIFTRRPCLVTTIATGKLDPDGAKHKLCSGGDQWGK